jgi:hypothetical protein
MREESAEEIAEVPETPFSEEEDGEAGCAGDAPVLVDLGQLGEEPGADGEKAKSVGGEGERGRNAGVERAAQLEEEVVRRFAVEWESWLEGGEGCPWHVAGLYCFIVMV